MPDPASDPRSARAPDAVIAGRYQPVRVVGRGGMGAVYEAIHTWTGRRVALKTLLPHLADDPSAVARFRREARAGVQGAHPHIVEVLDMGVDPDTGTLFLAQEFLVGEDLAARLSRDGPLCTRDAYELLIPTMAALDAAHRAGVVHRDVKPANLFLSRSQSGAVVPKVIDFGIAALADLDAVTRTGVPIGTPQYMAPEQARGARDLDARTDVWSMGVVWFEALTGHRVIDGPNLPSVFAKLVLGNAPDLRRLDGALPPAVRDAIEGALQVDRTLRHPSMAAFARALLDAPSVAHEPWLRALSAAHAFEAPPPIAPARTDAVDPPTPITQELPLSALTPPPAPPASPEVPPSPTPTPSPIAHAPVTLSSVMAPRWPLAVAGAVALAALLALALHAARPAPTAPRPAPSALATAPPTAAEPTTVTPPALALPPPAPDVSVVQTPAAPRRPMRPHAPPTLPHAAVPAAPDLNGAPLLEP